MSKKRLREEQKFWLDQIQERFGDNWAQMTDACNIIAAKTGIKPIGESTIRNFFSRGYGAGSEDRLLTDKVILLLYKAYGIEPSFSKELMYDMEKDTASISEHAKFCKQYITDVSLAKGIYRMDLAKNADVPTYRLTQLFTDKLSGGLNMGELSKIKEHSKVNFSPRFREFLEKAKAVTEGNELLPIVGYVSLKSSDQVIFHSQEDRRTVALQSNMDKNKGRAIELKGPTINPAVKEGMLYFYNEAEEGVGNECIDETCVVETEEGEVSIKMVERTNKPDVYRLHSLIGTPIETAKLKRASPIRLMLPGTQLSHR